jgi:sec-independent protein translocase protein TatC
MTAPTPEDDAALEATKAPLLEHLLELRKRLIYALISFALCFVVCFYFSEAIFNFLTRPLGSVTNHLIYTSLTEVFFTHIEIAMFGGFCLGFPAIAAQAWLFIAPGLYRREKSALLPFLIGAPIMFATGAAFVYYVMLPASIVFFGSYQVPSTASAMGIQLQARVSEYLDLVMMLIIAFGVTFQLPVVLSLLGKLGIVTARMLKDVRRFAYVGLVAVAGAVTPADAPSMLSLAVPLLLLYEISILSVMIIEHGAK